jgi:hypothetical protein
LREDMRWVREMFDELEAHLHHHPPDFFVSMRDLKKHIIKLDDGTVTTFGEVLDLIEKENNRANP